MRVRPPRPIGGTLTQDDLPGFEFIIELNDDYSLSALTIRAVTPGATVGQAMIRRARIADMRQAVATTAVDFMRMYRAGMDPNLKQSEETNDRMRAYLATLGMDEFVDDYAPSPMRLAVEAADRVASAPRRNPGRPVMWTHQRLAQLAAEYVELHSTFDPHPNRVLAERHHMSVANVAQRIASARKTDPPILTPTVRGRGGGVLTDYGNALVEAVQGVPIR